VYYVLKQFSHLNILAYIHLIATKTLICTGLDSNPRIFHFSTSKACACRP